MNKYSYDGLTYSESQSIYFQEELRQFNRRMYGEQRQICKPQRSRPKPDPDEIKKHEGIYGRGYYTGRFYSNKLDNKFFSNANINDEPAYESSFIETTFKLCELDRTSFRDSILRKASFINCWGGKTVFCTSDLEEATIDRCTFSDCDFTNVNMKKVKFINSSFHRCNFSKSDMSNIEIDKKTYFSNCNFTETIGFDGKKS